MTCDSILEQIARERLNIPTLQPRNCDRLDFHTLGVCAIREALFAAYCAGIRDSRTHPKV